MKHPETLIAIGTLILSILVMPAAQAGTLRKGMAFTQARANLIEEGWRPVNAHAGANYEYIGTESALINARYYELESCAVDRPLCIFNYRRGKGCLRLVTRGEELPQMRVENLSFRCPAQRS